MSQPKKNFSKQKGFNQTKHTLTDCPVQKLSPQSIQNPQSFKHLLKSSSNISTNQLLQSNAKNHNQLQKIQQKLKNQWFWSNSVVNQNSHQIIENEVDSSWIVKSQNQKFQSLSNKDQKNQVKFLERIKVDQILDDSSKFSSIQKKIEIEESLFQYLKLFKKRELSFTYLAQKGNTNQNQSPNIQKDKMPFVKFSVREMIIFGFNTKETKNYVKSIENYCKSVNLLQTHKPNSTVFKMLLMTNIQKYLFKNQVHIFKSKTKGCYLLAGLKTQNQLLKIWKNIQCFDYRFLVLPNFLNKQPYLTIISLVCKLELFIKQIQKYQIYGVQVVSYEKQKSLRQSDVKKQTHVSSNLFCLIKVKKNYSSFSQMKVGIQLCQFIKNNFKYLVFKMECSPKFIEKSQLKKIKFIVVGTYLTLVWQKQAEKEQKLKLIKYLTHVRFEKIVFIEQWAKEKLEDWQSFGKINLNNEQKLKLLFKLLDIKQAQQKQQGSYK